MISITASTVVQFIGLYGTNITVPLKLQRELKSTPPKAGEFCVFRITELLLFLTHGAVVSVRE